MTKTDHGWVLTEADICSLAENYIEQHHGPVDYAATKVLIKDRGDAWESNGNQVAVVIARDNSVVEWAPVVELPAIGEEGVG